MLEQDQEQDDDHGVPCSAGRVRPSGSSLNGREHKFAVAVLLACSLACLLDTSEDQLIHCCIFVLLAKKKVKYKVRVLGSTSKDTGKTGTSVKVEPS